MKKFYFGRTFNTLILLLISLVGFSQPTITSFSPSSGPAGSTTVTIVGTNFNATAANDVVFFGATKATVLTASTTTLTVTVPNGATYRYISVTNLGTNLTAYSSKPFITTFACGGGILSNSFSTKKDSTTNTNPASVVIEDFDGDGKADVATVDIGADKVSVLRNTGSSGTVSFAAKSDFTTAGSPYGIAAADIDGDGKPDLIVANSYSNSISVLRNTGSSGTISFAAKSDFTTGTQPYAVAVADFNRDGKPDVAVTNNGTTTVSLFKNTSTSGSISFAAKVDLSIGSIPWGVAAGDFDGDGKPDLAVTTQNPSEVVAFRDTGTGSAISFAAGQHFTAGAGPTSIAIGDLDGDGKPDVVTGDYGAGNAVSILRNTGTSGTISFASKTDFGTSSGPISVAISDLDGDGKPDLAVADADVNKLSVLRNTSVSGTFSFETNVDFTTGTLPYDIAAGDLDGDGKPDLAVPDLSDNKVSLFRNLITSPVMTSASAVTICSGTAVNLTLTANTASTYTWVAANNPHTTGESTSPQSGSVINNTLVNDTSITQVVTYTVTPTSTGSCGTGSSQTVTVTVNPAATMTSASSKTICSGDTVNLSLTSNLSSTYSWVAADNPNTAGEDLNPQVSGKINSIITNYTTSNQTVTYTVTPTVLATGCTGTAQTVTITVRPAPQMTSSAADTICSGGTLAHGLTSGVSSTYHWIASNNPHTTGESTTLQSGSTISNTLTNDTTISEIVAYTVTPTSTSGSCAGVPQVVDVVVYPVPVVTSRNNDTICTGGIVNIILTGNILSTYTWKASNNIHTTGEDTTLQTSSALIDTIVNNTYSVQVVTYTITPTSVSKGCSGTAQTFSVTVLPLPTVSFSGLASVYCSNHDTVALSGSPRGGTFFGTGILDTSFIPSNAADTTQIFYAYTDAHGCTNIDTDTTVVIVPPVVPICKVTVDSLSRNVVTWDKPSTSIIDSFHIYREISSSFVLIASHAYTVYSTYTDTHTGINPDITSYEYAISSVDTCGVESALSPFHRTIHLGVSKASTTGFNLFWNDYIGFSILQYRIQRKKNSGAWTVIDSVSYGNVQYHDPTSFLSTDTVLYKIQVAAPACSPSRLGDPNTPASAGSFSYSNIFNATTMASGVSRIAANGQSVKIYPNPFAGQATVSLAKEEKDATIRITDILGKEKKTIRFSGSQVTINKEDLQPGIYSLQVITEKGIIGNEKIIVQ